MSQLLKEVRENLELLPMSELRSQATKNYGIKLSRDNSKEDIINMIIGQMSKSDFAKPSVGDRPEPGWARIKVQPQQGRNNFPFYVACNDYDCFIPYNVVVDVPIKIIGVLNDAVELRIGQDEFSNRTDSMEQSYVFSEISRTEGPDPRPGYEVKREAKIKAKRDFADKYGYWPSDTDLREARQSSFLADALNSNK